MLPISFLSNTNLSIKYTQRLKKKFEKESIIYSITIDEHFADSVHDFTDAISTLFDFINNPIICDFQGQAIIAPKIFNKNIFEVIFI
jgi:hypothetical protein